MNTALRFQPDYAVAPGAVLEERLLAMGMSKSELARRCGRPQKTISEIVHGKAAITPETALQLERVVGVRASVWLNLEMQYRLKLAEQEEGASLASLTKWAKKFPLAQLTAEGWLEPSNDDVSLVSKLLAFFGVGTIEGWRESFQQPVAAYRRSPSFVAAPEAVAAWLRCGELRAQEIDCAPFDAHEFRQVLREIRARLTRPTDAIWDEVVELCARAGVALVLIPEFPKTHLSGAARWLSPNKALIQQSVRHKSGDHLWFSFFHEAGHLLLHNKKVLFVDEQGGDQPEVEEEANRFARDWLLAPKPYAEFVAEADFTERAVRRFAKQQKIAPGIVVGRLQRERHVSFAWLNGLKEKLTLQ